MILQVETLVNRYEIFGAFGICLALLTFAVIYLARKNTKLEEDYRVMSEKAIEALVLGNKIIDDTKEKSNELKQALSNLQIEIAKSKCGYEGNRQS